MAFTGTKDLFSRQVLLPGVGAEGQARWAGSTIQLFGKGAASDAAMTALRAAGIGDVLAGDLELSPSSLALVLSDDQELRRELSRSSRSKGLPILFGWTAGSGYALFLGRPGDKNCPCFECFEVMNPKAFSKGEPSVRRVLGAAAATEVLLWVLKGSSPLENRVSIFSPSAGISFHHEVRATPKCPAFLLSTNARMTP